MLYLGFLLPQAFKKTISFYRDTIIGNLLKTIFVQSIMSRPIDKCFFEIYSYFLLNNLAIIFPISSKFSRGSIIAAFVKSIFELIGAPICIGYIKI